VRNRERERERERRVAMSRRGFNVSERALLPTFAHWSSDKRGHTAFQIRHRLQSYI
jgi:hypothetical protein